MISGCYNRSQSSHFRQCTSRKKILTVFLPHPNILWTNPYPYQLMPSLRSLRRMVCYMSPGPVLPLTLMTPHQGGGGTQRMALALNSFFSSQVSQGGGSTGYLRIRYCFCAVCALFSVVGFLFSFCLATTTAAQSGAIAGLGTAFITKPLLYEVLKEYTVTVFICYCLCSFITRSTNSSGLRTGVQIMALEQSWRSVYNGHPPL